ncbi:unannotated protein [freshwater metagenome]|uniref:Unannotated protein n=1 Tax=freshwater metagenome TaxID=449393 RepID=A0A6J7J5Y5_9ZZZZ
MVVRTATRRAWTWRTALLPAALVAVLCIFYADGFLRGAIGWETIVFTLLCGPAIGGLVIAVRACRPDVSFDPIDPVLSTAATLATVLLVRSADLAPTLAIGIVGVVAGLLPIFPGVSRNHAACGYAGSFAGACSPLVLPGTGWVVAAGALTGVFWMLLKGVVPGIGGRIGAITFVAVFLIWAVAAAGGWDGPGAPVTELDTVDGVLVLAAALAATLTTYGLAAAGRMNVIVASALPTVGFTLLILAVDGPAGIAGPTIASAWLAGSATGMTASEWVLHRHLLAVAGVLTGIFVVGFEPTLVGLGGDFGTMAFIAVLAAIGLLLPAEALIGRLTGWSEPPDGVA